MTPRTGHRPARHTGLDLLEERSRVQEMFRRHLGNLAKLVQQLRATSSRRGSITRYYMHDQATRQLQLATNLLPVLSELGDPDGRMHGEALEHFRLELARLCPTRS